MNLTSFTHQQALMVLNEIASIQADHEAEIRTKDEIIAYYKRAAEMATRSKYRALNRKDEHRKDMIVLAFLIVGIALAILIGGLALHEFILWGSGQ